MRASTMKLLADKSRGLGAARERTEVHVRCSSTLRPNDICNERKFTGKEGDGTPHAKARAGRLLTLCRPSTLRPIRARAMQAVGRARGWATPGLRCDEDCGL